MNTILHFLLLCQSCRSLRSVGLSFGGRILRLIKVLITVGWEWWRHKRGPFFVLPRVTPTLNPPLDTMSMHVHKTLCPFYTITKIPPATRGRDEGGKGGHNSPGTESLWRRHKVPTMSQILSSIHLLPKDLRFEHRGAKPLSCPGRHLASLCPCCFGSSRTKSASLAQQRFFFIHPSFHTAQY